MQIGIGYGVAGIRTCQYCILFLYSKKEDREKHIGSVRVWQAVSFMISPVLAIVTYIVGGFPLSFAFPGLVCLAVTPFIYSNLSKARKAWSLIQEERSSSEDYGEENVRLLADDRASSPNQVQ